MTTSQEGTLPVWLQPVTLKLWSTEVVSSADLHFRMPVRTGWLLESSTSPTRPDIEAYEQRYRGSDLSERLIVNFLPDADPAADLKQWVETGLHLTGTPIDAIREQLDSAPSLLEMIYHGSYSALKARLNVEEVHCYSGLVQIPEPYRSRARFYILLARRDTFSWKITLSFRSATLPGMDATLVNHNDHVRAGASLGFLELT